MFDRVLNTLLVNTVKADWFHKSIGSHPSLVCYSHPYEIIWSSQSQLTISLWKIHVEDFNWVADSKRTIVLKYQLCHRYFPTIFCKYCEKLDFNTESEDYFQIYILLGKNLSATMPAAPKVAFPRPKLLQVPLIVRYLLKLVGALRGTFCEVQKLGGCCIGFRHWSKELPKFRRNGPINTLSNEPSELKKGKL